ncbi:neuronal acetylcholine receptor subunit alpha-5-like [Rhopilema esculentum]|uniref:neuronal acetylcholine receptor subunit alpha-5-like n=1 Tax=Rhopilema esculentum TaxID=499914 RepID=UPI0031D04199
MGFTAIFRYIAVLITITSSSSYISGSIVSTEQRLIEHLLTNYSKEARPTLSQKTATNVSFGLELVQLINVNDRYQMITVKVWVRQNWKNELVRWDPKDWDGIKSVQVDGKLMWTPDIVLYNNADSEFSGGLDKYKTRVILYSDGSHYWLSPSTFTSTCKIDITYFPFDKQICSLKYGSWAYDSSGINMMADNRPVVTSQYINSSEWEIVEGLKTRNSVKYACCPYPYLDVTVKLVLKRKPLYYIFNVITPCLVLAVTILFGFFLPPESGERISLTITILLAVAVFLQLVSDSLPRNSDSIPILAIFYMVIMTESALSLVTTCIVLMFHFRSTARGVERPPPWMRKLFFQKIGKLIKIKRLKISDSKFESEAPKSEKMNGKTYCNDGFAESYAIPVENGTFETRQMPHSPSLRPTRNGIASGKKQRLTPNLTLQDLDMNSNGNKNILDDILTEVQIVADNFRQNQATEENQDEWKHISMILDRMFFWLFLITLTISAVATLLPVYLKYN